MKTIKSMKKR